MVGIRINIGDILAEGPLDDPDYTPAFIFFLIITLIACCVFSIKSAFDQAIIWNGSTLSSNLSSIILSTIIVQFIARYNTTAAWVVAGVGIVVNIFGILLSLYTYFSQSKNKM
jgi:hypothetical protein